MTNKPYKVTRVQVLTVYAEDPILAALKAADDINGGWKTVDGKIELNEDRQKHDEVYQSTTKFGR